MICIPMFLFSCLDMEKDDTNDKVQKTTDMDIHSYARPAEAVIKHLSLDLNAVFGIKKLSGTATYDIEVKKGVDSIYLDTRNLDVHQVMVDGAKVEFSLGENVDLFGQALKIGLNHQLAIYDSIYISLSIQLQYPLITVDRAQERAAKLEGVTVKLITDFVP